MDEKTELTLSLMINAFPQSQITDLQGLLMAFGMVIEGYSQESAQRAAKAFIAGSVPGHETRFCPSCAQFATEVARQQGFIDAANALPKPTARFKKSKWLQEYEAAKGISQPQGQTADSEQTASPQERERVAEKMRQLAAQLQREAEANPNSRHYVPDGKTAAVEKYELPYDAPGQIHITGALAAYFERKPAK